MSETDRTGFNRRTTSKYLIFLICLVLFSFALCVNKVLTGDPGEKYSGLIVSLMVLFNHMAFFQKRTGWSGKIIKIIAVGWLVFGMVYLHFSRMLGY